MAIGKGIKFAREVRAEVSKITWPKLRETRVMTLMVLVLVVLVALYLLAIDATISTAMNWLFTVKW
ncbi:MAG: preprotein translocase subunit SecE [Alphaproteobacteria bacterium]|nr:preprotein translocase subunit SecE [Alphaproteobacteria bacterium]MDD9920265.1 preprotein translocase subunit SecE [Alphaproteobacteria bacterium]